VGVPAPVVGLVWSSLLLARPTAFGSGALLLVASVAMVSPLRIPRPRGPGLIVFLGWAAVLIAAHALRLAAERGQVP
jgi:phosphatidylserine synthase